MSGDVSALNGWYGTVKVSQTRSQSSMDFHHLETLVDYHYWGRDRILDCAAPLRPEQFTRDLGSSFPSVRDTLVHLYGADWIWRERWDGNSPNALPSPAGFDDVDSIRRAWVEEEKRVRAVLARLGPTGVLQPITYSRKGVPEAQPFWQMLQHLVNHGTYHRGQVTTMLRQLGASAVPMDLIAFYRERASA
jgi:uncharacterized damage-inducible protein DinB